jgi:hypothetical protein
MDGNELLGMLQHPMRKRNEWLVLVIIVLILLGLVGMEGLVVVPVKVGFFLTVGWIWFLGRVVPVIHLNWAAIGLFLLCSALVIYGLQRLGGSLAANAGLSWSRRWPWGIYLGCWILFLAAMGFTGAVHQIAWLWSSGTPWIENGSRKRAELVVANVNAKQALVIIQTLLLESTNPPTEIRRLIIEQSRPYRDDCTVLLLPPEDGPVRAVLVVPRAAKAMKHYGFFRMNAAGNSTQEPADQLDPILARLNAGQFDPVPPP